MDSCCLNSENTCKQYEAFHSQSSDNSFYPHQYYRVLQLTAFFHITSWGLDRVRCTCHLVYILATKSFTYRRNVNHCQYKSGSFDLNRMRNSQRTTKLLVTLLLYSIFSLSLMSHLMCFSSWDERLCRSFWQWKRAQVRLIKSYNWDIKQYWQDKD